MTVRFAQISDTHLSPTLSYFHDNFCRTIEHLNAEKFDFLINTGDISLDGADRRADLEFSRRCHALYDGESLLVHGNHDVGNEPYKDNIEQEINARRLQAYRDIIGPDRWRLDVPHWTLLGLNNLLCGSGLEDEGAQAAWLEVQLSSARANIALFVHKPLYTDAERTLIPGFTMSGASAQALEEAIRAAPVRFVACGHLHQYSSYVIDGVHHYLAPSTAFIMAQKIPGDTPALGCMRYTLRETGHEAEFVPLPHLEAFNADTLKGAAADLRFLPLRPVRR